MTLLGHVRNGVVVLDGNLALPEGVAVTVTVPDPVPPAPSEPRLVLEHGKLPVVTGGAPGTWTLTSEMIGQIFLEEDLEMMRRNGAVPC